MARRRTLLFVAGALLVAVPALYGVLWTMAAARIGGGIIAWAEARRVDGLTVGWERIDVGGFPFAFRVRLERPVFGRQQPEPGYQLRASILTADARPWSLARWSIDLPEGLVGTLEPGPHRAALGVTASSARGNIRPEEARSGAVGGVAVRLALRGIGLTGDGNTQAEAAELATVLPNRAAPTHRDVWWPVDLRLAGVRLPHAVPALGPLIAEATTRVSVKGTIGEGNRRAALTAWRDAGGTVEMAGFRVIWGPLAAEGEGTLALDGDLQPIGALTTRLVGYGDALDALGASGELKPGDVQLAKLALGFIAKPGAGGRSELQTPLTLQNGKLYAGPIRLLNLPRFTWE